MARITIYGFLHVQSQFFFVCLFEDTKTETEVGKTRVVGIGGWGRSATHWYRVASIDEKPYRKNNAGAKVFVRFSHRF